MVGMSKELRDKLRNLVRCCDRRDHTRADLKALLIQILDQAEENDALEMLYEWYQEFGYEQPPAKM